MSDELLKAPGIFCLQGQTEGKSLIDWFRYAIRFPSVSPFTDKDVGEYSVPFQAGGNLSENVWTLV